MSVMEFKNMEVKTIEDDVIIPDIAKVMYNLEHPYVIYKDNAITPLDMCNILLSDKITINV